MNSDLTYAKKLLHDGGYTCVLHKSDVTYTSKERGVKPLLNWLESDINIKGFYAADKVVGKATAFLYVIAGVSEVYADVMSLSAKETLDAYGVTAHCGECVKAIRNRTDTGFCPMEQAVWDINDPHEAKAAIINTLKVLSSNSKIAESK